MFLLDDKRISEINMVSGRTKKRTPKLHPLLNSVVTMASSHSGEFNMYIQSKACVTCPFWLHPLLLFFQVCGFVDF